VIIVLKIYADLSIGSKDFT